MTQAEIDGAMKFIREIAALPKDEEMEREDAWEILMELIDDARSIAGVPEVNEKDNY